MSGRESKAQQSSLLVLHHQPSGTRSSGFARHRDRPDEPRREAEFDEADESHLVRGYD
jgi:hypothetical protein